MLITMLVVMCGLLLLSIPVAVAIGFAAIAGLVSFTQLPLVLVAQQAFASIDKFPLAAVPFFILAGNLMGEGGISRRMVDFAKSLVGGLQGGLACTCVLTCMIFAAVSGSSVATTFAIGAILIPAMVLHGYPRPFAASLQATAAELGVIIPPSIPLILYGVSAEVSIGELFVAGVGPGIFVAFSLMVFVWLWCRWRGYGVNDREGRLPVLKATSDAGLALMMPVIILGGIYGGVFTPTEASVVAVFYALVVSCCVYRELDWKGLYLVLRKSVIASSVIMFIIAMAGLFSFLLTRAGIPAEIGAWITANFNTAWTFLLAVNAFLFVIGMFIETSASIIVLAPILAPVAAALGIHPVHFGMVMVINLAMGMITPPFGVNLFAACSVAKISLDQMVKPLIPFILVIFSCLMVVTYFPPLSMALRNIVYLK